MLPDRMIFLRRYMHEPSFLAPWVQIKFKISTTYYERIKYIYSRIYKVQVVKSVFRIDFDKRN